MPEIALFLLKIVKIAQRWEIRPQTSSCTLISVKQNALC